MSSCALRLPWDGPTLRHHPSFRSHAARWRVGARVGQPGPPGPHRLALRQTVEADPILEVPDRVLDLGALAGVDLELEQPALGGLLPEDPSGAANDQGVRSQPGRPLRMGSLRWRACLGGRPWFSAWSAGPGSPAATRLAGPAHTGHGTGGDAATGDALTSISRETSGSNDGDPRASSATSLKTCSTPGTPSLEETRSSRSTGDGRYWPMWYAGREMKKPIFSGLGSLAPLEARRRVSPIATLNSALYS